MKNKKIERILFVIVAFVLAALTTVSVTFSWIDDVKQVEFDNDDFAKDNAPLKTGVDINSTVNISKSENVIDFGCMLTEPDYVIQNQSDGKNHVRYENTGGDSGKAPDWANIDSKKGYFYESGDMHLSGCYSDGEAFYFPRHDATGYREGNKDDENVNYISFTVKVSSPDANVDFWFEEIPSIINHDTQTAISNARYAIIVDGEMHVYSDSGYAYTVNSNMDGTTAVSGVRKTSNYTYGDISNTTASRGANSNTLFSIKKGGTVNLTVKIWLENGFDATITASDISLKLVSSWAYSRDVTIIDQTSSCKFIGTNDNANSSWLGTEKLYLVLPDVLTEMCTDCYKSSSSIRDWDDIRSETGYENAPFYDLRSGNTNIVETGTTNDGFTYYKVKNVPMVYINETMMLFRANDAWNTGNYTTNSDNYGVKCYNWWRSALPNKYTDVEYRLYGGSHDNLAKRYFDSSVDNKCETYQGYGTWGDLIKIQVDARTKAISTSDDTNHTELSSSDLAPKTSNSDSKDLYICDYSDKNTSGEVFIHGMSYEESSHCWFAYVPISSTRLQFYYHASSSEQGWWGYYSWGGKNPQQRPGNSYKYFFTHRVKHGSSYDGIGYWEGADSVYLLRNGNIGTADKVYSYMYYNIGNDDYNVNAAEPGEQMQNTGTYDPRNSSTPIFSISTVHDNNPGYYMYVKFAGVWDDNSSNPTYGASVPMCPGCYFDWEGNKWLGSLTESEREDIGGGGDEEPTTEATVAPTVPPGFEIETTDPTADGLYAYGNLSGGSNNSEYVKFSSGSTGGYVVLYLEAGKSYTLKLKKKSGSFTTYGSGGGNTVTLNQSNISNQDYNMNGTDTGSLSIHATYSALYKVQLEEVQSNSYRIRFYQYTSRRIEPIKQLKISKRW